MSVQLTFPEKGAALVIGGSGGAGSVICQTLADAGASVAFTYRSGKSRADATLGKLKEIGVQCSAHALDGTDASAVKALVAQIAETYNGLHTVIYAGGPRVEFTPLSEAQPEQWRRFMANDADCVFNVVHAAIPYLRQSQGVFTACVTMANRRVLDFDGLSAVPKAAVESLVRQIAAEEAAYGVRANSVGLGWIDVGMGSNEGDQSVYDAFGPEGIDRLRQIIRLGQRPGTGQELANAAVFLSSQQASYITGQAIMVDGGASL